jgi:hypothetical protein
MFRSCAVGLLALALLSGCGPHETLPPLHPVKGKVVKDGISINGQVDDDGLFELTTLEGRKRHPGAPAGEYRVVYSPPVVGKSSLPFALTKTFEIAAKANELVLELSDRD